MPLSSRDLRDLADQCDQQALDLARDGRPTEGALKMLEAARLREMAEAAERLTGGGKRRTVRTVDSVDTTGQPGIVKRAAARARRHHAAQAAMYGAGVTIQALADHLGEKRSRVSHWMAEADAGKNFPRPIPRVHADALDKGIRIKKADGTVVTLRIPRTVWGRIAE